MAVGDLAEKLIEKTGMTTKGGKRSEKEKAKARELRIYRVRRKEFLWEYVSLAQSMFEGIPFDLLEKLERKLAYVGVDDRIPDAYKPADNANEDVKAEFKRCEIAWGLLYDLTSYYETASFVEVLAEYEELTKIRATKNMKKLAEQFDEEIVEASKVVKK